MNLSKIYKTYLLSQNGHSSSTKLSKILNNKYSHDKITRYLNTTNINSSNLWNTITSVPDFKDKIEKSTETCLIIDDTIIAKEFRKETNLTCWHYDHAKGRFVKGVQLLTCYLANEQISLPINYRIITKTEKYKDKNTNLVKRKSKKTKNEYFREMLEQSTKRMQSKYKYILSDSWFCSKENLRYIDEKLNNKFIFAIKSNRLIKILDDTHNSAFRCINKSNLEPERIYRIKLKGLSIPLILIKKVFKNGGNDRLATGYYISNDLALKADKLYGCYQKRWQIEEYHRFIKQNISIGSSPCRGDKPMSNHIGLSLMAYVDFVKISKNTKKSIHMMRYEILIKSNLSAFNELNLMQHSAA